MQASDRLIPWYFVAFFAVIALVDGAMVTMAIKTNTGLVTDHPYEKGLAYNRVIEAERKQEALGWKGGITLNGGILRFSLVDKSLKPVRAAKVIAVFTRPAKAGMDFSAVLKPVGDSWEAQVPFPAPGLWEARVYADNFQASKRVVAE